MKNTHHRSAGSAGSSSTNTRASALASLPTLQEIARLPTQRQTLTEGLLARGPGPRTTGGTETEPDLSYLSDENIAASTIHMFSLPAVGFQVNLYLPADTHAWITRLRQASRRTASCIAVHFVDLAIRSGEYRFYRAPPIPRQGCHKVQLRLLPYWWDAVRIIAYDAYGEHTGGSTFMIACVQYARQARSFDKWVSYFSEGDDVLARVGWYFSGEGSIRQFSRKQRGT